MSNISLPYKLVLGNDADTAWRQFRQRFEIYILAAEKDDAEDKQKIALLLHSAGQEGIDIYNSFGLNEEEAENYEFVLTKFEEYCSPVKNEMFERYIFQNRNQMDKEPVEKFCADLKILAKTCNYGDLKDDLIRDRLVFGLFDKRMTEKLLKFKDLKLEEAVNIVQAAEITHAQMGKLTSSNSEANDNKSHIDAINKFRKKSWNKATDDKNKRMEANRKEYKNKCSKCGTLHDRAQCIAYGKTCYVCGGKNHFARLCRNKAKPRKINIIESSYNNLSATMDDLKVDAIQQETSEMDEDEWFLPINVNNNIITFKLDSGSQTDVIPEDIFMKMVPRPVLEKTTKSFVDYGKNKIEICGCFKTKTRYNNVSTSTIVVAKGKRVPILGLSSCIKLGLIKKIYSIKLDPDENNLKQQIFKEFKILFQGLGCVSQKYKIRLKPDSIPVVQAPRRVAFSIKNKLKCELERMIKSGMIKKIETPTDWVSSMVVVEKKDGSFRICLDPQNLNECIKREHYQIPTRDEIESELAGAVLFSKLDIQNGFYQVPLDEESRQLCTFNTPFGRHCFLRMPFGITSAPEVFQRILSNIYEGLEGVRVYIDDILIWGRTKEEHNKRLRLALQRTQTAGLTLNKDKCEFAVNKISFLGENISSEGIYPDESRIADINKITVPTNKSEVKSILGLITYLGKYIPNLSQRTVALRSLTKASVEWNWNHEHEKELQDIKNMLTNRPILQLFDPDKESKISTDASSYGLGAVLLQKDHEGWKPVAYASRAMTEVESRYAQVEKEALGLVFGCDRFHDYVYGRSFIMETDHKPLLAMRKRAIAEIPPRIQRMFIRLLKYNFVLEHMAGKQLIVADTLSRIKNKECKSETEDDVQIHVNLVVQTTLEDVLLEKIRRETSKDIILQAVIHQLNDSEFTGLAAPYRKYQTEITEYKGLLLKGNRIIIPNSMRKEMLHKIHIGHLGIEKIKRRARESVFWSGITADITEMVGTCEACQRNAMKKTKEVLTPHKTVQRPWFQVGTDLFQWRGSHHIVVMDYYSCYPVVVKLKSTNAEAVIKCLKEIFSLFGIPNKVVSDNGPPFSSREFKNFMVEYNFGHITSSPGYAQSNGLAEKAVQIAKNILEKTGANEDVCLGFLSYRTTPLEGRKSPAEMLFKRKFRTTLPQVVKLKPKVAAHKANQKKYYDRRARHYPEFNKNDVVRVRDFKTSKWLEKAVIEKKVAPKSFQVKTERNVLLRRNTRDLRKTSEKFEEGKNMEYEDYEERQLEETIPTEKESKSEYQAEGLRRSQRRRRPVVRLNL